MASKKNRTAFGHVPLANAAPAASKTHSQLMAPSTRIALSVGSHQSYHARFVSQNTPFVHVHLKPAVGSVDVSETARSTLGTPEKVSWRNQGRMQKIWLLQEKESREYGETSSRAHLGDGAADEVLHLCRQYAALPAAVRDWCCQLGRC